jgi:hypothetical protein
MYFGFRTYFRLCASNHRCTVTPCTGTRQHGGTRKDDMIKILAASWPDLLWPMTVSKGEVIAGVATGASGGNYES